MNSTMKNLIYNNYVTFTSCYNWNISGPTSSIKNNRPLNPWNEKMSSFTNNLIFNTGKPIKNYRSVTSINWKEKFYTKVNYLLNLHMRNNQLQLHHIQKYFTHYNLNKIQIVRIKYEYKCKSYECYFWSKAWLLTIIKSRV